MTDNSRTIVKVHFLFAGGNHEVHSYSRFFDIGFGRWLREPVLNLIVTFGPDSSASGMDVPRPAQCEISALRAGIDGVRGDHVSSTFNCGIGGARFRRQGNGLAIGCDDPLSSFFMESALFVVFRWRIARFN